MTTKTPPARNPAEATNRDVAGRILIGAAELVDLPAWGIRNLRAKIDTGARTSALHVTAVEEIGPGRVRFEVVLDAEHEPRWIAVEAPISRTARVRSSNGKAVTRYFVVTQLRLGPLSKPVEISLAERTDLRFRMLLGRTALGKDVLIDPGRRYVATKRTPKVEGPPPRTQRTTQRPKRKHR